MSNAQGFLSDADFSALGLEAALIEAVARAGIDAPTDVQRRLIPAVLEGRDCLIRVRSGGGKTNSYLLPIAQRTQPGKGLQALIIKPTRAMAMQLQKYFFRFVGEERFRIAIVARGDIAPPRDVASGRAEIVIATPRGAAEVARGGLPKSLRTVVVDDVDTLFDLNGEESLENVFEDIVEHECQAVLIGATLDERLRKFADDYLHDPHQIEFDDPEPAIRRIRQQRIDVDDADAIARLTAAIHAVRPRLGLVFTRAEDAARELLAELEAAGLTARWIDDNRPRGGDSGRPDRYDQRGRGPRRDFRRGREADSEIVVASDPATRRLATLPVSAIFHFELPHDAAAYEQRLANCDRLSRRGVSITLVRPDDADRIAAIELLAGGPLEAADLESAPVFERSERSDRPERGARTPRGDRRPRRDENASRSAPPAPTPAPAARSAPPPAAPGVDASGRRPIPKTLGSRFPVKPRPIAR